MTDLLTLSLVISIGIQVLKETPLHKYMSSWYQLIALVFGVVLGMYFGFTPLEGFLSASASMGLYDTVKLGGITAKTILEK